MDIDIAERDVEDTLYRSRPFVEIIICSLEGRQQTDKPVASGASGWNELGINVCWMKHICKQNTVCKQMFEAL